MKHGDPGSGSGQPIADHAGLESAAASDRDPYEVLDELMLVVEQLCPVWPERELFSEEGEWLL
jgi:hypothetical protein